MRPIGTVADCYSPLTLTQAKALKASGVSAIARYLGAKSRNYTKGMTPQEVAVYNEVGLHIISVFEGEPGAVLNGHAQGVKDATDAMIDAVWLHQPHGSVIYFAVDFGEQEKNDMAVEEYFAAVNQTLNGAYLTGDYGGYRTVKLLQTVKNGPTHHWQTVAWSPNEIASGIHMFQRLVDTKRAGIKVDVSDVYQAPGWWPLDVVKPQPAQHYVVTVGWFDNEKQAQDAAQQIQDTFGWHSWTKKGDN